MTVVIVTVVTVAVVTVVIVTSFRKNTLTTVDVLGAAFRDSRDVSLQSGEACWWRVCYQWGLPCLVITHFVV